MLETNTTSVVLASSSPRRQALLREAGIPFRAMTPPLHEPPATSPPLSPTGYAEALSYFKARTVADRCPPDACVLGADTIVVLNGRIMGKAADADEARQMLRTLSQNPHQVITGVCLIRGRRRLIASEATTVRMRPMTEEEIDAYVASGEWVDKAGAYAIQETADRFVVAVEGSFTNVVGLPIELVRRMIVEMGCDA